MAELTEQSVFYEVLCSLHPTEMDVVGCDGLYVKEVRKLDGHPGTLMYMDLKKLAVQPGDILVFRPLNSLHLTEAIAKRMREHVLSAFDGAEVKPPVLFLDGFELAIIRERRREAHQTIVATSPVLVRRLAKLVDKARSYLAYEERVIDLSMLKEALVHGLGELEADIKELYFSLGGPDVWRQS